MNSPLDLVLLTTYWGRFPERKEYLENNFKTVKDRVDFTDLRVHRLLSIETQGETVERFAPVAALARDFGYTVIEHKAPAHLGNHLNFALDQSYKLADVVFYIQDDYFPVGSITGLFEEVSFLMSHKDRVGIVRYPYEDQMFASWPEEGYALPQNRLRVVPKTVPYCYSDAPHLQHRVWREKTGRYSSYQANLNFFGSTDSENIMVDQAVRSPLQIVMREEYQKMFSMRGSMSTVPEKWGHMQWQNSL